MTTKKNPRPGPKAAPTTPPRTPARILELLEEHYPEAWCTLDFENPYQLLAATILSAQCTDERVNLTTPALFRRYPDPASLARAAIEELEGLVRPTGFFRNKAKNLKSAAGMIVDRFGGRVPDRMEELILLPGVARKTANVVLGAAFGVPGVVVDTHVKRVSARLGWTKSSNPDQIEQDLMALWPRERWTKLGHQVIAHGRSICAARKPRCPSCFLGELCPYPQKEKE